MEPIKVVRLELTQTITLLGIDYKVSQIYRQGDVTVVRFTNTKNRDNYFEIEMINQEE